MSSTPVATTGLTFDEEFNSFTSSADGSSGTWMTNYPFGGEGAVSLAQATGEQEYYSSATSGPNSPFSLSNGILSITASPATGNPYGLPYTSGLISTQTSLSQTYGYFDARVEMPLGQGLWPAFWFYPTYPTDATELDVFENLGRANTIYSTTHGANGQGVGQAFTVPDVSAGFHTYGVDWEPTTVTFYLDGVKLGSAPTPASMDVPMHMMLNLGVGGAGSWPGAPNASTVFPATMQIDYVHAYATAGTSFVGGSASHAAPIVATLGSGLDTLSLVMSEDAYLGDAQFTVSVDGQQIGGVQTVTASHAAGATQTVQVQGTFTGGSHSVSVNFLNDLYAGTASTDRNLYVNSISLDGNAAPHSALTLLSAGSQSIQFCGTGPTYQPTTIVGSGKSTLALQIAEDAYQGDAQFTISVDGTQIGGTQTATALHGSGSTQAFDVMGNFLAGPHTVSVNFLNDAYGGSSSTDRNLYVQSATIDNTAIAGSRLNETSAGPQSFTFQGSTKPDTLTVGVSEDAYKGDAQYFILVDGYIVGYGANTATASHAAGQVSLQTVTGSWGNGPHSFGVAFLNDLSDAGGDRNLYINSVNYNGNSLATNTYEQSTNGTAYFQAAGTPNTSNLTLHLAEDAYLGNAQFTVSIDGKQVGGVGTVSTANVGGATQAFNFSSVLAAGAHDVGVSFINDLYGGSSMADRNFYVHGAELNGASLSPTSWTAAMMSNGTEHFTLTVPS